MALFHSFTQLFVRTCKINPAAISKKKKKKKRKKRNLTSLILLTPLIKEQLAGSDDWKIFDATQEFRLVLPGLGNVDIFHMELDVKPFEGLTVRLFDPQTRLWTIYRAFSNAVELDGGKVGLFDGDMGEFFDREVIGGKDVIVKFHWDKRTPKVPIYSRAFTAVAGRIWEWNWYSNFSRP